MPFQNGVFQADTLDSLRARFSQTLREQFGEDMDLSPESVLGALIEGHSRSMRDLFEQMENVYNSFFIRTATGSSLDQLALVTARMPAQFATGTLSFTLRASSTLSIMATDVVASSPNGITFQAIDDLVIASSDSRTTHTLGVRATTSGIGGNVNDNTLIAFGPLSPTDGSVTNLTNTSFMGGAAAETDDVFRARILRLNQEGFSSSAESIRDNVLRISSVGQVRVHENRTNLVDTASVPSHSVEVVARVSDTTNAAVLNEIAVAIYERVAAGIGTYSRTNNTVTIPDINTTANNISNVSISFSLVSTVPVSIIVRLPVNDNVWEANRVANELAIRQRIHRYIGGTVEGVTYDGVDIGEPINSWTIEGLVFEQGASLNANGEIVFAQGASLPGVIGPADVFIERNQQRTTRASFSVPSGQPPFPDQTVYPSAGGASTTGANRALELEVRSYDNIVIETFEP